LFRDRAGLSVGRACAELRAGRPILIEGFGDAAIVAALDTVPPATFALFSNIENGTIALSAQRARTLGLVCDGPVTIPLQTLDRELAFQLAMAADLPAPGDWTAAHPTIAGGIALCKHALLLPAVLAAHVTSAALPPDIQRLSVEEIDAGLNRQRHDLEIVSEARVPLAAGVQARFVVFRGGAALRDQIAVIIGNPPPGQATLVRLHSACLTGDLFGSLRCDCGDQLRKAVAGLTAEGGGVLLYLDQEGRGIGISNKMRAYALQDEGFDTIDADAVLGFGADERRYELAAAILQTLGLRRIRLMTNNPEKVGALRRAGIEVVDRRPLTGLVTAENRGYLSTKARRGGHMLDGFLALTEPADPSEG
jgi:GTP cyclohydrolase II